MNLNSLNCSQAAQLRSFRQKQKLHTCPDEISLKRSHKINKYVVFSEAFTQKSQDFQNLKGPLETI